jgi:hypothetical protein
VKAAVTDRVAWREDAACIGTTWVRRTGAPVVHAVEWEAARQRPYQCPAPHQGAGIWPREGAPPSRRAASGGRRRVCAGPDAANPSA